MVMLILITLIVSANAASSPVFSDTSGTVMIPLEDIYSPISYWTHVVREHVPCVNKVLSIKILKMIAVVEDRAQMILESMYGWLSSEEISHDTVPNYLEQSIDIFFSQSLLNDRLINFWNKLFKLTSSKQFARGTFQEASCNMTNYNQRLGEGLHASKARKMINDKYCSNLSRKLKNSNFTLPKVNSVERYSSLTTSSVNWTMASDEELELVPFPISSSEFDAIENLNPVKPKVQFPGAKSAIRDKRSSAYHSMSNDLQNIVNKGCSLQQFSSPVTHAIAFAIVQSPQHSATNQTVPQNTMNTARELDFSEPLSESVLPYKGGEDSMDLCYLGPNTLLDSVKVLNSVYDRVSNSISDSRPLQKFRYVRFLTSLDTEPLNLFRERLIQYSTSLNNLGYLTSESPTPSMKGFDVSVNVCLHSSDGDYLSEKYCSQTWLRGNTDFEKEKRSENLKKSMRPVPYSAKLVRKDYVPSKYNSRHRDKRSAPLSFLTTYLYTPLLGVASTDELDSVKSYLTQIKNTTSSIKTRLQEQDSFNDRIIEGLHQFKDQLNDISASLINQINRQANLLVDLASSIANVGTLARFSHNINHIQSNQLSLLTLSIKVQDITDSLEELYQNSLETLASRRINIFSTMGILLSQLVNTLSSSLPENRTIPKLWAQRSALELSEVAVLSLGRSLITILRIPVVWRSSNYQVWKITALPMQIVGSKDVQVTQLIPPGEVIISDATNQVASKLSLSQYNLCRSHPGYLCAEPLIWHSLGNSSSCIAAHAILPLNSTKLMLSCPILSLKMPERPEAYGYAITANQWLISVLSGPLAARYKCGSGQWFEQQMDGVTAVTLKDCDLYLDEKLIPKVTQNVSNEITLKLPDDFQLKDLTNSLGSIIYSLPPINATHVLPEAVLNRVKQLPKLPAVQGNWASSLSKTLEDLSTQQSRMTKVVDLPKYVDTSPTKHPYSFLSSYFTWAIVGSIIVAGVCIIWKMRSIMFPASAILASHQIPLTSAELLSNATNGTTMSSNLTVQNITNWWVQAHETSHTFVPWGNMVLMIIMMLFMIHHCLLLMKLTNVQRQLNLRNFIFPYDKKIIQHRGEYPLLVVAVIKFQSILGPSVCEQIGFQVATLPPPDDQYYVDDSSRLPSLCNTESRWQLPFTEVVFRFNWHNCCIKSMLIPALDTCVSLPAKISIKREAIFEQTGLTWTWLWKKMEVTSISSVFISTPQGHRQLYAYTTQLQQQ